MAKQTINLFKRNNIKAKGPQTVKRTTTSNYVNFNQLGKQTVGYTTAEIYKGKKGLPMIKETQFTATGGPIKQLLGKLQNARPGEMGKIIAGALNPTKEYKGLVESEKAKGNLHSGFDNPQVKSGAKVKRGPELTRAATAQDIVQSGSLKDIETYGSKLGKFGKQVRTTFEQDVSSTKNEKLKAAKQEQLETIKERHGKKARGIVKGVANIFGGFMSGLRGN